MWPQSLEDSHRDRVINNEPAHRDGLRQDATDNRELLGYVAGSLALCLAVRLSTLGSFALWYDEILTAHTIALDWTDLAAERLAAKHSPLYFWMLKGLGLQGASEFFLRLPSAILNSVAGAIFVAVAWQLSGRIGAIVMMILYCFGPFQILYAQDARPYALLMFFLAVATLGYVLAIPPSRQPDNPSTTGEREIAPSPRLAFILATFGTIGIGTHHGRRLDCSRGPSGQHYRST